MKLLLPSTLAALAVLATVVVSGAEEAPPPAKVTGVLIAPVKADPPLWLSWERLGGFIDLRLQVAFASGPSVGFHDFVVHVFDDRKREVPCVPLETADAFVSFGSIGGSISSGFYRLNPEPGLSPAAAEVTYQGQKYTFAFKTPAK